MLYNVANIMLTDAAPALIKAMARMIEAERNISGGQYALNATQLGDLQTINRMLSVSFEILKDLGGDPLSAGI